MPLFLLILILVVTVLAVAFALQNTASVTVTFFTWQFSGSLGLVLLITLIVGVLLTLLVSMPAIIRRKRIISKQKRKIKELEDSLKENTETPRLELPRETQP